MNVEIVETNEHYEIAHIPGEGYFTKLFMGDHSYQHGPFETLGSAQRNIERFAHRWTKVTWPH